MASSKDIFIPLPGTLQQPAATPLPAVPPPVGTATAADTGVEALCPGSGAETVLTGAGKHDELLDVDAFEQLARESFEAQSYISDDFDFDPA